MASVLLVAPTLISSFCAPALAVEASEGKKTCRDYWRVLRNADESIMRIWDTVEPVQLTISETSLQAANESSNVRGELKQKTTELHVTGEILTGSEDWRRQHLEATTIARSLVYDQLAGFKQSGSSAAIDVLLDSIKNNRAEWGVRLECASTLNNAGNCALYDGDNKRAIELYKKALHTAQENHTPEDSPVSLAILRNLYCACHRANRPEEAAAYVEGVQGFCESLTDWSSRNMATTWLVTSTGEFITMAPQLRAEDQGEHIHSRVHSLPTFSSAASGLLFYGSNAAGNHPFSHSTPIRLQLFQRSITGDPLPRH